MARIRTIKPEFPQSESMGRISRDARLCFVQLWTIADDSGRLRGASRMLASLLFPYDDDAPGLIDGWLTELEREECIHRYKSDGQHYIEICNWLSHQKIDKPSESKIPSFANIREDSPRIREHSTLDQGMDQGMDQGEEADDDHEKIEKRKTYGTEKNVMLTENQYHNLETDLGDSLLKSCIEELSSAKAMKGYKYKRDDLAIRKWVIDAVKKKQLTNSPTILSVPIVSEKPTCKACGSTNLAPAWCRVCHWDYIQEPKQWLIDNPIEVKS